MKIIHFITASLLLFTCLRSDASTRESSAQAIIGAVPREILTTLPEIQELNPELYQKKIDLGKECIYELCTRDDGLGWNAVIADIEESVPHFNKITTEIYTVLNGTIEVFIDDQSYVLNPGDVIAIPLNAVHWGRSLTDKPARIMCTCVPAWSPEDHYVVQK